MFKRKKVSQLKDLEKKALKAIIAKHPLFENISNKKLTALVNIFRIKNFRKNEIVFKEGDLINGIHFVYKGQAEATKKTSQEVHITNAYEAGESLDLDLSGILSKKGRRAQTIKSTTDAQIFHIRIEHFKKFLYANEDILKNFKSSKNILERIEFIKRELPFEHLPADKLYWLAHHLVETSIKKGEILFYQGDPSDSCYLITSGELEVYIGENEGKKKISALKAGSIVGESSVLMKSPHTCSVKATKDSKMLMLDSDILEEALQGEHKTLNSFAALISFRHRPKKYKNIKEDFITLADSTKSVTLKNPKNNKYFRLSETGYFIWQRFDGNHTISNITSDLMKERNEFHPLLVSQLKNELESAGFLQKSGVNELISKNIATNWLIKIALFLEHILTYSISIPKFDKILSRWYEKFFYIFFSKPVIYTFNTIIAIGLFLFFFTIPSSSEILNNSPYTQLIILLSIPVSLLLVIPHELAHALAVKHFKRTVYDFGVGWFWISPMAYCDTSDMWLESDNKKRLVVDIAGIYIHLFFCGIAMICTFFIQEPNFKLFFWIIAVTNYFGIISNLDAIIELDGYYILMDYLDKPNLKTASIRWLLHDVKKTFLDSTLKKEFAPEITYWIYVMIYLIVTIFANIFVIQIVLEGVLGHQSIWTPIILALVLLIIPIIKVVNKLR